MMDNQAVLQEIIDNLDSLPEVPVVALQVSRMLDDPNVDARALAKVITMDPSLTTKVLRLCNSAEYGLSRKIATISEAVSILGYKELKKMLFTIISHGFLNRPVQGYALEKGALWVNAMTCAVYARHIAQHCRYKETEVAFTGALLRDIGKIALENYVVGHERSLEHTAVEEKISFTEAEEKIVGASHTEVGAQLARKWNLPDSLISSIAFHHHPSQLTNASPDDKKLVAIIHLADTYTMMTGQGVGVDGLMYPLDPVVFQLLGLSAERNDLEVLYAELLDLQNEIDGLTAAFDNKETNKAH